jgi:hypothetical protein
VRPLHGLVALGVATALWLPALQFVFTPAEPEADARALAARHLALWSDPALRAAEVDRMRARNAEWDFMGRTFLVLALANEALRTPSKTPDAVRVIDAILDETLRLEAEHGFRFFMMDYAGIGRFQSGLDRSIFVDGEIALMMGARRILAERADFAAGMRERVEALVQSMGRSPARVGESYPDEGWMFCNTVALVAIRMLDVLDGADHAAFIGQVLASLKANLTDPATGLLVSSFTFAGQPLDGPEGSSIWMVIHCLDALDRDYAADQYRRARAELGRTFLGFGWAIEWPASWQGPRDVDSGPIIPVIEVSAGASGMAFLGAATVGDTDYLQALHRTLDFAAFPIRDAHGLRYAASNQVGDAVLLYASVMGPLWDRLRAGGGAHDAAP